MIFTLHLAQEGPGDPRAPNPPQRRLPLSAHLKRPWENRRGLTPAALASVSARWVRFGDSWDGCGEARPCLTQSDPWDGWCSKRPVQSARQGPEKFPNNIPSAKPSWRRREYRISNMEPGIRKWTRDEAPVPALRLQTMKPPQSPSSFTIPCWVFMIRFGEPGSGR